MDNYVKALKYDQDPDKKNMIMNQKTRCTWLAI